MVKHQETHPTLDVEGCFGCKIAGIQLSSAATPTRRRENDAINQKEKRWDRDMDAYKRLRRDGLQPPNIDGSARLEQRAEHKVQVETGIL